MKQTIIFFIILNIGKIAFCMAPSTLPFVIQNAQTNPTSLTLRLTLTAAYVNATIQLAPPICERRILETNIVTLTINGTKHSIFPVKNLYNLNTADAKIRHTPGSPLVLLIIPRAQESKHLPKTRG